MRCTFLMFHCNLMYSAIEEERRREVIDNCYWPILRLASSSSTYVAIEMTGYTLECISELDPNWISACRELINEGKVEFIGSGYAQIISTLVPVELLKKNLELGKKIYQRFFAFTPQLWLPNELAVSHQVLRVYHDCGIQSVILEHENHRTLCPEVKGFPEASSIELSEAEKRCMKVLWIDSTSFQKFQRYAHADIDEKNLIDWINTRLESSQVYALYANDAEVFNFRPGRYGSEGAIIHDEWARIDRLCKNLIAQCDLQFSLPSSVLDSLDLPKIKIKAQAKHAIAVKKQAKYNITRWAVSGRNDLALNTWCARYFHYLLRREKDTSDEEMSSDELGDFNAWKTLCYLWSSDFRTHITPKRWEKVNEKIQVLTQAFPNENCHDNASPFGNYEIISLKSFLSSSDPELSCSVVEQGRLLIIKNQRFELQLNQRKGFCVHRFIDTHLADRWLYGTLEQGFFEEPELSADYFTGHLTFDVPFQARFTDLVPCRHEWVKWHTHPSCIGIRVTIQSSYGAVNKWIKFDLSSGNLEFAWDVQALPKLPAALRYGYLTINPDVFSHLPLTLSTHCGGSHPDLFDVADENYDHGTPVHFKTSSNNAFGMTQGHMAICSPCYRLELFRDAREANSVGMSRFHQCKQAYLFRLWLSASEIDETATRTVPDELPAIRFLRCRYSLASVVS